MVEGVEKFAAELEFGALGEVESTSEREVESLHARAVDGVAAHVAEGEGSGRREGCWIEPFRCIVRAGGKNWLAGEVGANGIFAEDGAGVGGVAENGNGERESALDLVDGGEIPIAGDSVQKALARERWEIVDHAGGEAMADIAG